MATSKKDILKEFVKESKICRVLKAYAKGHGPGKVKRDRNSLGIAIPNDYLAAQVGDMILGLGISYALYGGRGWEGLCTGVGGYCIGYAARPIANYVKKSWDDAKQRASESLCPLG